MNEGGVYSDENDNVKLKSHSQHPPQPHSVAIVGSLLQRHALRRRRLWGVREATSRSEPLLRPTLQSGQHTLHQSTPGYHGNFSWRW